MTEPNKNKFIGFLYSIFGGVIVGITMLIFQSSFSDNRAMKVEITRLDKEKLEIKDYREDKIQINAEINKSKVEATLYTDKQIIQLREDMNSKLDMMLENQRETNKLIKLGR